MFSKFEFKTKIKLSLLYSLFSASLMAQENQDTLKNKAPKPELSSAPTTSSLPIKVSFDKGVKFATPDDMFGMQIRFRMQNKAAISYLDENTGKHELTDLEGRIRRARLRLDGHFLIKKLEYHIQLSFSRADMDWDNSGVPNVLRDAFIIYKFTPNFELTFGQTKLPGNRQRVNSSADLQFVDRSIVNATYNIDRDFLLMFKKSGKLGIDYVFKAAISNGEGRNSNIGNAGACYSGRVELLPMGKFTDGGDYFESDLAREEKPKLSIAGGSSYNDMAVRTAGQLGRNLVNSSSLTVHHIDFLFKYRGISIASEWMQRLSSNPIPDGVKSSNFVAVGTGFNLQAGYLFKSNYEIALRYSNVSPEKTIYEKANYKEEYTLGASKYFKKHNVKLQSDFGYMYDKNMINKDIVSDGYTLRVQLQVGI